MNSDESFSNTEISFNNRKRKNRRIDKNKKIEDMSQEINRLSLLLNSYDKYINDLRDVIIQNNIDMTFLKHDNDVIRNKLNVYKKFIEIHNNIQIND